jgi:hypothetical protein
MGTIRLRLMSPVFNTRRNRQEVSTSNVFFAVNRPALCEVCLWPA